ncbi:hypothetical protein NP493_249g02003 [Ridgeia piscesae]|uniref:Uncharacterized protein n=1 Tax=Ridgeia piscesae TaxID=27915 RepID=A0AAD9UD37_RIDPI|nr:hypothetical protein NP493_249g02003 [Ridgeia piscesae]
MLDGGQALNHETEAATPTSVSERKLTAEEQDKLARDTDLVSAFKQNKLEEEAQRNWDLFYKRNTTKFFKDRHWTTHEFKELCDKKMKDHGADVAPNLKDEAADLALNQLA